MTSPDETQPGVHRDREDVASAAICIAFGIAYGVSAFQLPDGTNGQLGPGSFPLLLAAALVLVGVLMLVPRFSRRVAGGIEAEEGDDIINVEDQSSRLKLVVLALIVLGYVVLWPFVGMALSAFLVFAVSTYVRRDRLATNALVAVVFTLSIIGVFELGLGIRLPGFSLLPGVLR